MRIALVGGLAALALAWMIPGATADVGPRRPDPARDACAGLHEGAACVLDDKAGTCRGPHVSRLSCQPGPPPSQGSAIAAPDPGPASTGSAAAGSAHAPEPGPAEPAATPGHKRGCAVAEPGSAATVGLALAVLALRRRRRSRSMP